MRITKKAEYAMILMEELTRSYIDVAPMSVAKVAIRHNLSVSFMKKIANILQEKGMIKGEEGVAGGYRLRKKPEDITISDTMRAINEPFAVKPCCDTFNNKCERETICPHKSVLHKLQWALEATYGATSLDKLVKGELPCSNLWKKS